MTTFLISFEADRILLRTFYGPIFLGCLGQEASTVNCSITEVESIVNHLRECLYEAASASTVMMDEETERA